MSISIFTRNFSTCIKSIFWYRSQYTLNRFSTPIGPDNIIEIFRSKDFLILNKPFDLITYEFKNEFYSMPSLFQLLKEKYPYYYNPKLTGGYHVLHRLDAVTSGCIVVPLKKSSFLISKKAFQTGNVKKSYLALVYGNLDTSKLKIFGVNITNDQIEVQIPIGDDSKNLGNKCCTLYDQRGIQLEKCVNSFNTKTKIKLLEYGTYKGRDCTKIYLEPITGKRHQLRVIMNYLGHPIVGDILYGIDDFETYRTMLHSYKIQIKINTKNCEFLYGIAPDPFLNNIDPDWKPHNIDRIKI
jgi:23S rRNA-/tRNA-specific pseudouridylate synthase